MHYFNFHLGDWAKAVASLSGLEEGVYLRLLRRYYNDECPIPADQAHRSANARTPEERAAVDYVLSEFFELDGDGYRNKRADEEIAAYREKSNKAAQSAAKRWNNANAMPTHSERNANASKNDANAMRTQCEGNAIQYPITNIQKKQEQEHEQKPPIAAQSGGRFAEFWIVYPNKKGRANAEKAWKRKKLDAIADDIIADVRQRIASDRDWLRGYIPHGSTYVNAEGWRDGMPTAPAPTQSKQMQGLQNLYNALTPNQGFDNDADTRLVLDFNP